MAKFNYEQITDIASVESDRTPTLSALEYHLILTAINDRIIYRGAWFPVTDTEWDAVEAALASVAAKLST